MYVETSAKIKEKMDYGRLLHQLPEELRTLMRKYEALRKKLINNEWSTKFNEICLQEDVLPNFTRVYTYTIIYKTYT